jgi:hypothetical protein
LAAALLDPVDAVSDHRPARLNERSPVVKERNRNKTHQQRFQGRHDQPLPPPVETEQHAAPFGPDRDGEQGPAPDKDADRVPAAEEKKSERHPAR